jgi:hypothetical protein
VLAWSGVLGVLTWTGMELLSSYTTDSKKKYWGLLQVLQEFFFQVKKGKTRE